MRLAPAEEPLGIVIRNARPAKRPAVIWAYMWAADDDETQEHWHQQVPKEHAA
jgi:hypothetical protein